MKSSLFFASTPNFQSLCTVLVKLGTSYEKSETLRVQPQVIKCREIIFTDEKIIASPSLQENTHIYVILQQSYWKTGQFQALCKKLGLEFMKPVRVISAVFQSCFSYTMKAKLAPLWNKVGEYLINGRDFLTNPGPLPAVNVDINVTGSEICLALKGFGVYFPLPSLGSLHVSEAVLRQFETREMHTIPEYAIQEKWSHVLPSMKKGKVISITQSIPRTSPFKRYKEMRRYWKNAYGYRLPEDDSGIYFVNIHFPVIGTNIFTYPSLCVRQSEPTAIPRINPVTILAAFLKDVRAKMPTACGLPLQFCEEAMYTEKVMAEAYLQVHLLSSNNLSSSSQSQFSKKTPLRNLSTVPQRQAHVQDLPRTPAERAPSQNTSMIIRRNAETPNSICGGGDVTPNTVTSSHAETPNATSGSDVNTPTNHWYSSQMAPRQPFSFQDQRDVVEEPAIHSSQRLVHMFQSRPAHLHSSQRTPVEKTTPSEPARMVPRIVPTFKPQVVKKALQNNRTVAKPVSKKSASTGVHKRSTNSGVAPSHVSSQQSSRFNDGPSPPISSGCDRLGMGTQVLTQLFQSGAGAVHGGGVGGVASVTSSSTMSCHRVASMHTHIPDMPRLPQPIYTPNGNIRYPAEASLSFMSSPAQQMAKISSVIIPLVKRKAQVDSVGNKTPVPAKKQRKPQTPQQNVDIELLAVCDQLNVVNALTLTTWLKSKDIPVKCREKKADLISKVMEYITAQKAET